MDLNLKKFLLILVSMSPPMILAAKTSNVGGFSPALATWYGDRYGAGSGNCVIYSLINLTIHSYIHIHIHTRIDMIDIHVQ